MIRKKIVEHRPNVVACLLLFFTFLQGCVNTDLVGVKSPSGSDIFEYASAFGALSGAKVETGGDYILGGYNYVDYYCERYFNALENRKSDTKFAIDVTSAGLAQAVAVLTYFNNPDAIASANAGGTFLREVLQSYDKNYNFSAFSTQLRKHVLQAQGIYKDVANQRVSGVVDLSSSIENFSVLALAHQIVQGYARTCTPAQLQLFMESSLASTSAKTETSDDVKKTKSLGLTSEPEGSVLSIPPFVAGPT